VEFTPVPAAEQAAIKSPARAGWFAAVLDLGMVSMTARPTLSPKQSELLQAQGQRLRTRTLDGKVYVWVEDIPASDLNETGNVMHVEGEDGEMVHIPVGSMPDDEVPL
jgi:hypothetical protein